jgi:hypothetical protein
MNLDEKVRSRDDRLGGLLVITAALAVLCIGMTGCSGPRQAAPPDAPHTRETQRTTPALRIPVRLALRAADGKEVEDQVKSMKETSPAIAIFRGFF